MGFFREASGEEGRERREDEGVSRGQVCRRCIPSPGARVDPPCRGVTSACKNTLPKGGVRPQEGGAPIRHSRRPLHVSLGSARASYERGRGAGFVVVAVAAARGGGLKRTSTA